MSEFINFLIKVSESNKANIFKNVNEFKNALGLADATPELFERIYGLNRDDSESFLRKFYTWKNNAGGVALLYSFNFEIFVTIFGILNLNNDKIILTFDIKNKREMWKVINETI